ncbi:GNAT family N-acetyltransferase [Macrococcoides goetzii]|uniref:GNAT family N-acetyltransferase n=1 Tax=Macrococcus sp. PK TaxID=2801919 RepID=UPI001F0EE718|nr:GNAT family N-acetyltransferase [Macrococcus sp. PK]MCH4985869.1 GNAT family N-acetyltransferase [Macrococcus sp. PK]MCH4986064.1 GNAT family N-acetyltransferase [Macrococcus sp. PK]
MKLIQYTHHNKDLLEQFELTDEQLRFVKSPEVNVSVAKKDSNRTPIFGLNDEGKAVVFFVLHEHSEFESQFKVDNSIYIRSFSTDHRHLRKGYAKQALIALPEFIMSHFPHIKYITLLVDVPNSVAHDMYLKLGFEQGNQIEGERYPAYCMIKKI